MRRRNEGGVGRCGLLPSTVRYRTVLWMLWIGLDTCYRTLVVDS